MRPLYLTCILCVLLTIPGLQARQAAVPVPADTASLNSRINSIAAISDDDSAIAMYNQLLPGCKATGYTLGIIKTMNQLGQRYFNKGDDAAMIRYLKEAVTYALQAPEFFRQLPSLYNNLGICYQSSGNYDSSLSWYYKAITAQEQYSSTISTAIPYINLALLYKRLGRYNPSAANLQKALHIATAQKDTRLQAATYLNLGDLYAGMDKPDSFPGAERYLTLALSLAREPGYKDIVHKSNYSLALLAENRGLIKEAIRYYEAALRQPMGIAYDDLIPLINLGNLYLQQGEYARTITLLSAGLTQAQAMRPPPDYLCDFYLYLGKAYKAQGNSRKAVFCFDRYITLAEALRGEKTNAHVDKLQREFEAVSRDNTLMKKELLIARQRAALQRKTLLSYVILSMAMLAAAVFYLLYRNQRRKQRQQQEQALWDATFQGEEQERSRIAHELHDGIGANLSNAKQWFAQIQRKSRGMLQDKEYNGALTLLGQTLSEVRNTAHALMPEQVLRHGLAGAVKLYTEDVQRVAAVKVRYQYLGYIGGLEKNLELLLYRCIQELVQNAVKHAGADRILVQLSCHEALLAVTVEDDGHGIKRNPVSGFGLQHIRHSIRKLNGTFSIQSDTGGTSVCFEIDIRKRSDKRK